MSPDNWLTPYKNCINVIVFNFSPERNPDRIIIRKALNNDQIYCSV